MSDPALLPLAESIADGSSVDWDAVEARAGAAEQPIVRQLRVLANLTLLHRSLPAQPEDWPRAEVRRPLTTPAIGSWGHLALLERLGGGTFGDVYRAWDPQLEREVALKLLRVADRHDDPQASRITREGRLLARVRHPNVVTVYGVATHDQRVGLWMELIEGATLEQALLERGRFSAREAALVGIDLCRALAAIHAAGLVHRDVKAQNVMREAGGRIVLMDLGTGREIGPDQTQDGSDIAGTPLYLAPEVLDGAPASAASDVYSLGVLLYHLVTGAYPVRATTIEELRGGHANQRGVRLRDARADLPTAFVRVLDRAIASDAGRRYASAGALEGDLAHALDDSAAPRVESSADGARIGRGVPWLRTAAVVAGIVAMAAAGVFVWPGTRWGRPGAVHAIAVLPLANLSGDPAQEYFADGMTDELIGTLGRLAGLKVISRTSVMRFKGSHAPLTEIADALHVDAVLEGSVLVLPAPVGGGAKKVRISARLIHAGTELQIWDKSFDSVLGDVLALQRDVAKAVAQGIDLRLTSGQQAVLDSGGQQSAPAGSVPQAGSAQRTQDFEAFNLYLKGRYYWNKRTVDGLNRSIQYFQDAIDRDRGFARAWAGLSDAYALLGVYGGLPRAEAAARASAAASTALELDDSLAEAHASVALIQEQRFEWDAAEKNLKRAIELNPGYSTAHHWYADYLAKRGRLDEALGQIRMALALDPLSVGVNSELGALYIFTRQTGEAVAQLEKTLRMDSGFARTHMVLAEAYANRREFGRALAEARKAAALAPRDAELDATIGHIMAAAGRRDEALKMAEALEERYRQHEDAAAGGAALVYVALGDKAQAFAWLDRAAAIRDPWIAYLAVDPRFDSLRPDPRLGKLLAAVGLAR